MEQVELDAAVRENLGSSESRKMRMHGLVPAVLYGRSENPVHLKVSLLSLRKAIAKGENVILSIKVDGKGKTAMVKELQYDPVEDEIIHVDFYRVSLQEKININVPIEIVGVAKGAKEKGGVLDEILREIEVRCLPKDIPKTIPIEVTQLDIGDSVLAGSLKAPGGVEILTPPDSLVVVVIAPTILKEEKPVEEVAAEPELIGKEKEEGIDREQEKLAKEVGVDPKKLADRIRKRKSEFR